jgi:hypothetical protein
VKRCEYCNGVFGLSRRYYHPDYPYARRLQFCCIECEAWWWHDWRRYR